jgi:hypothetical protein
MPPSPDPRLSASAPIRVLERHELIALLADDGLSRTWSARLPGRPEPLELEELDPYVAQVSEFREAFLREAGLLRRASHPGLVGFTTATVAEGSVFGVRPAHEATTLTALLARGGPLPGAVAARVGVAILEALRPIHALSAPGRAMLHGDLTPSRVLVGADGRVLVLSSGLAVAAARPDALPAERAHPRIAYKAPEQVRPANGVARVVDARADAFAVGALLWEALVGHPAFAAASASAIVARILGETAPPLDASRTLPGFPAAVARALHPDPAARATPDLLLESLRALPGVATPEQAARELATRVNGGLGRFVPKPVAAAPEPDAIDVELELEPEPEIASAPVAVPDPVAARARAARERPPAPPSEARYVAPVVVQAADRAVAPEPQASIVLNVPSSGGAADANEVLASRARRRLATVKIDRSAIQGLLAADPRFGGAAPTPPTETGAPPIDSVQMFSPAPAAAPAFVAPPPSFGVSASSGAPAYAMAPAAPPPKRFALVAAIVALAALVLVGVLALFLFVEHADAPSGPAPSGSAATAAP